MNNIVSRLRAAHPYSPQYLNGSMLLSEAADEIERLCAVAVAAKALVSECVNLDLRDYCVLPEGKIVALESALAKAGYEEKR